MVSVENLKPNTNYQLINSNLGDKSFINPCFHHLVIFREVYDTNLVRIGSTPEKKEESMTFHLLSEALVKYSVVLNVQYPMLLKITLCTIPLLTKKSALLPFCVHMIIRCNLLKTLLSILLSFPSRPLGKLGFKRTITYLFLQINDELSYISILFSHCFTYFLLIYFSLIGTSYLGCIVYFCFWILGFEHVYPLQQDWALETFVHE